jgi:hypothetical protein
VPLSFLLAVAAADRRMTSMQKHDYFTDHFEVFLIASNIALMAMVILFMALSPTFQLGLLIASALSLVIGLELFAECVRDHFAPPAQRLR